MSFLEAVIRNEKFNKMSLHNVAMIIAPSLFPPKYVQVLEKNDLNGQVKMAAVCCRLVELILQCGLDLWRVPIYLWHQLQQKIQNAAIQKLNKHVCIVVVIILEHCTNVNNYECFVCYLINNE